MYLLILRSFIENLFITIYIYEIKITALYCVDLIKFYIKFYISIVSSKNNFYKDYLILKFYTLCLLILVNEHYILIFSYIYIIFYLKIQII